MIAKTLATANWMYGFFELVIVLAFACGWGVMEWQGRRLDRKQEAEERARDQARGE